MRTEKKLKILFQKSKEEMSINEMELLRTLGMMKKRIEDMENDFMDSNLNKNSEFFRSRRISGMHFRYWIKILFSQIRYMDKRIWIVNFVFNVCFALIPVALGTFGAGLEDVIAFLMLSSSLLGSISILVLSRLFAAGIGELSCTCYFNIRQLTAQQMFGLGIVNLLTLTFLICFSAIRWKAEIFLIVIYTAVPFVITVCICMCILQFEGLRNKSYPVAAAGAIAGISFLVLSSVPWLYCTSAVMVWAGALTAGIAVIAIQIRSLFHAIDKGDILCTDWN